jgi:hypothetical protein
MMTVNAFYGAGRVTCIRDGQDDRNGAAFDFELAVGRGVRLGCRLSRRLANRLNGFPFREGSWIYVFGPLYLGPGGKVLVKVVFARLLCHRQFDGEAVIELARSGGRVTRREVAARLGMRLTQAAYILRCLVKAGRLRRVGRGRGAGYELVEGPAGGPGVRPGPCKNAHEGVCPSFCPPRFGRRGTPGIHPTRPMLGPPGPDIGTTHPDPRPWGGGPARPPDPPGPMRETNKKRRRKTRTPYDRAPSTRKPVNP